MTNKSSDVWAIRRLSEQELMPIIIRVQFLLQGMENFFIRNVVAYDIAARMKYRNENLKDVADDIVNKQLKDIGANGGGNSFG